MTVAQMIEQAATSAETRTNGITDGLCTATYAALPSVLERIARYVQGQGIDLTGCLALECPNSVPGALTLLSLLYKGVSFFLSPPVEANADIRPVPHFCQYRVVINRVLPPVAADWAQQPEQFLAIEPNAHYQPHPESMARLPGKLYLRTSGSMGVAKIVVHAHTTLLGNACNCVDTYQFASTDRVVIPVPIAHMYGLGAVFLPALIVGAAIDLHEKTNLLKYLAHEKQFQPTIAFVTPALSEMLRRGFKTPRDYKVIVTSGQRMSDDLFRAFDAQVGGCLVNQYGSSEMGAIAACHPGDPLDHKATTIGTPMAGVQLAIRATSDGETPTDAEMGELHCQHPYGFEGYLDDHGCWLYQATPETWYATGDLAKRMPDGSIQVVGRAGNSVNRRGYLVQLADIERQMEKLDDVEQVVVVRADADASQQESLQGERIAAFCVLRTGTTTTAVGLRQHCFDLLPGYAIPDDIFLLETLPLLPSGKVNRQALAAMTTQRE